MQKVGGVPGEMPRWLLFLYLHVGCLIVAFVHNLSLVEAGDRKYPAGGGTLSHEIIAILLLDVGC